MNTRRVSSKSVYHAQSGVASIMVTMVMMIVVSLIVLGFAQISRREQRNTLDRQLSTQAFYAAESGINDAQAAINTATTQSLPINAKTSCIGTEPIGSTYRSLNGKNVINAARGIAYTCLLVSTKVPELHKTLGVDQEWVVPISAVDSSSASAKVANIKFTWPPEVAAQTNPSGCPDQAPSGYIYNPNLPGWNNCPYGAVRIDIVPVVPGDTMSRDTLASSDMVVFAYPSSGGGSFNYATNLSGSNNSHQTFAKCNSANSGVCTLSIGSLTSAAYPAGFPANTTYYARVHMLYRSTSSSDTLKIDATDAGGSSLSFTGAQAQIDSTGKAQDILRRIRVTVSLNSDANYNPYAVLTRDSVCKRYSVSPGVKPDKNVPGNTDLDNPTCFN